MVVSVSHKMPVLKRFVAINPLFVCSLYLPPVRAKVIPAGLNTFPESLSGVVEISFLAHFCLCVEEQ